MFTRLSHTYKALLLALFAGLAFSVSDTAVKYITPYYSVYQIIAFDMAIASALFLAFSSKLGGLSKLRDPANTKLHLLRGVMNFFGAILQAKVCIIVILIIDKLNTFSIKLKKKECTLYLN